MPVVGPHRCFMVFHRRSSWTRLSCPLCARQMPCSRLSRRAENCRISAVAVFLQGRHHPRRCAETGSHGLTVQQTTRFSCCSAFDKVFDVPVCRSTVSTGAVVEKSAGLPSFSMQTWRRRSRSHSCNVDAGHRCSHACRCATTGAGDGRDSAVNCGGSAVGTHRLAWFFRAVYTGTRPG